MKIAFIGQKGVPSKFGGVEKHVEELAVKMVEKGHNVFVYVRDNYTDKELKTYKGVKLIHLPSVSTKNLDAISHTFLATVHSLFCNFDIIHFHAIGPNSLAWIVKIFKRKTTLISTFHCQDYNHKKWGLFARMYLKLGEFVTCKVPDKTIAVSKQIKKYSKEKYGSNLAFIPNGARVDIDNRINEISKWNLEPKKYIVSVSRLVKHKNIHQLIEAFQRIEKEGKNPQGFKLVIVGDGFHTDNYVQEIKDLAKGNKNIIFTGNQTGDALNQLFSNAYLFLQPSEAEGLSIALLEAMSYGVAPLVSDIVENMDVVEDVGFSFRVNNIDSLVNKLDYLLFDSEAVKKGAEKCRMEAQRYYNWEKIANNTLSLYKEVSVKKESSKLKLLNFIDNE